MRDATPPHSPIPCMAPLYLGRGRYVVSDLLVINKMLIYELKCLLTMKPLPVETNTTERE